MRLIGNIIWFVFGGLEMAFAWFCVGCIAAITIVGLPWTRSCFVMALFHLWPFGREAISRRELTGEVDLGTGIIGTIGNILWLPLGLILAIGHVISAFLCFITIIGIPFGIQHLKLAGLAFFPIGRTIVPKEEAEEARRRNAAAAVDSARGA
ncbi:MAG TPA: YccF domain-containing protein [Candidatus Latescibacteria bacterium]|nr:hypothetical protein [Gemmatimonadota bacterium]HCV23216.1 YccF domain-containing protein [Candidatus Latescibacterota bacterium]HJN29964.1 YccF domain-containing protein [Candidatus Latescibacterota bacterium]